MPHPEPHPERASLRGNDRWDLPGWSDRHELNSDRWRWPLFIAAVLAVVVFAVLPTMRDGGTISWLSYGSGVASVIVLLAVERWPRPGVAAVGILSITSLALVTMPPFALIPLGIGVARAVRHGAVWWAAAITAGTLLVPTIASFSDTRRLTVLGISCVVFTVVVLGASLHARARRERMRNYRASLEQRRQTEAERERVRIARELHDVLAHSLSSISVQAGVAIHLADSQPERAMQRLREIRETSTSALTEVRQLLGVFRGDAEAELAPEPNLDALVALMEETRKLGLDIAIDDRLHPRPPATVQLALYRIVRESLTNAARYAPGSHVSIVLSVHGSDSVVEVVDTGATRAAVPGHPSAGPSHSANRSGSGRGILGMRERATLLGGELEAAPRGAGFAVIARIPTQHRTPSKNGEQQP